MGSLKCVSGGTVFIDFIKGTMLVDTPRWTPPAQKRMVMECKGDALGILRVRQRNDENRCRIGHDGGVCNCGADECAFFGGRINFGLSEGERKRLCAVNWSMPAPKREDDDVDLTP